MTDTPEHHTPATTAYRREWSLKRVRRTLRAIRNPAFVKKRWELKMVKTRYGLATLDDYLIDRRYGGRCGGTYSGRWGALGYRGTSSAHYYALRRIFSDHNLRIGPDDVLVDVGSGKGRVLNFWLDQGWRNRIIGIEIDERWASFSSERLARFDNVEVRCGDAFELMPREGTVIYIFNPFTREVTERFKDRLAANRLPGTKVALVYYMCNYADLFENDPAWTVTKITDRVFHPAIVARLD